MEKKNISPAKTLNDFTNIYPVSKTLRFELIPQGKTQTAFTQWLKEIEQHRANEETNLIQQDILRAEKYEKVKKILNEYHKDFIEKALSKLMKKGLQNLERYFEIYRKSPKKDEEKKEFEEIKKELRLEISYALKNFEGFNLLKSKNLFKEKKEGEGSLLEKFLKANPKVAEQLKETLRDKNSNEEIDLFKLLDDFKDFTTYFKNFHINRENLYSEEDKFSTIAHRLVHENLPKFCDNLGIYQKVKVAGLDTRLVVEQLGLKESLDDVFTIEYFNKCLTQSGIDHFNYILGGKSAEPGKPAIRGMNSYINNEINQKAANKNKRVPTMKQLYKLPLFERSSESFRFEPIENDYDLIERIRTFYYCDLKQFSDNTKNESVPIDVLEGIKNLLKNIHHYREGLYVQGGLVLTQISQKIFGRWDYIKNALMAYYDKHIDPPKTGKKGKIKERSKKVQEKLEKWLKEKQWPITLVEKALTEYKKTETNEELKNKVTDTTLCDFFARCGANAEGHNDLFDRIEAKLKAHESDSKGNQIPNGITTEDLLNTNFTTGKKLIQDKPKTLLIKNFLDAIQGDREDITAGLLHFIKTLLPREEVSNKNELFYAELEKYYRVLAEVTPLYNKVRNYLTQRPYSVEKVKLNFENPTLLDGWDKNKEINNSCVLFRKKINDQYFYYLVIMSKEHKKKLDIYSSSDDGDALFEKMIYKQVADPTKDLLNLVVENGKTIMVKGRKDDYGENKTREKKLNQLLPPEINRIRKAKTYTAKKLIKDDLTKFIEFYQKRAREYFADLDFKFKNASDYNSWKDFLDDVKQQGYFVKFIKVSEKHINSLVEEGKLFLFKIHNKDFSDKKKSKGKDNLHTYYWKWLFDPENLNDVVIKLNGKAEVFFRPKSINYSDDVWQKGHHHDLLKDKFSYPIISNKRFSQDKFYFHVPVTLNFKSSGKGNINERVNEYLRNNPDVHIIGIDRGELHLLYVSVINQKGEIVEQFSLNEIINEYNGNEFKKNYLEILNQREAGRDKARKDWQIIENISQLKDGYMSHVIHKICRLILKYNAVVVMEDLNSGFKRGRQKVERQVYQKFEEKLIKKLNYLVLKDKLPKEPGGVLNALQLTSGFESFEKIGKQSGIVFYVPAAYTSGIDPLTGYVHYLTPLKMADSIEKAKKFYGSFKRICFNLEKQWFEFSFDYNNFEKVRFEGKSEWTVCTTNTERYVWNKSLNNGRGGQELVKVTERLEDLFYEYNIFYGGGECIREQIVNVVDIDKEKTAKKFYSTLNFLLNVTLKLRNNNGKSGAEEEDYILSPVEPFFDSRTEKNKPVNERKMPVDADANGAYHIAKKGLFLLTEKLNKLSIEEFEETKKSKDGKSRWLPHSDWFNFVQ